MAQVLSSESDVNHLSLGTIVIAHFWMLEYAKHVEMKS